MMMFMRRMRRGFVAALTRAMLPAAIVIFLFIFSPRALAQGSSGMVPDPMSTAELMRYADRLGLSADQRRAVEAMHDQYKAEFRILREGEIAQLMNDMRRFEGGMPNRKDVEAFVKRMNEVNQRIEAVDGRLLDMVQSILSESQAGMMQRVRQQRARQRFQSQQMLGMINGPVVDLSESFAKITITPAEFAAADPIMASYETTLTGHLRKLYEAVTGMFLDLVEVLEREGITADVENDPAQMEKMMQVMQRAWMDIIKNVRKAADDAADLNTRTFKTVSAALPVEQAREFRKLYYQQAFAEAVMEYGPVETLIAASLKSSELTEAERTAILAARDEFRSKGDPIQDEAVSEVQSFRQIANPFEFDQDRWTSHQTKMDELRKKAVALNEATLASLKVILGPERSERITAAEAAAVSAPQFSTVIGAAGGMVVSAGVSVVAAEDDSGEFQWGSDAFLPPAIGERDIAEYARRLELDESQTAVVNGLLTDYQQRWAEVETKEIAAVQRAAQSLWAYNQETGQATPPTAKALEECYRLRRAALEAIARVDVTMFDDILVAVLKPADAARLERVRWVRERQVCNRVQNMGWAVGGGQEGAIDLSRLLRRHGLSSEKAKAIDPIMAEYEKQITVAYRVRFESAMDFQERSERFNTEVQAMQADGKTFNPVTYEQKYKEILEERQKAFRDTSNAVRDTNRQTMTKLAAALEARDAAALRAAYNQKAHPNIFNDPSAAERPMSLALSLPDLSPDQRARLDELTGEYRPTYASLCDQMVSISEEGGDMMWGYSPDPEVWKEWQKRQEALQKIGFDRTELNQRAISRLKGILNEQQLQAMGPLPEAETGDQQNYMY